MPRRDGLPDPWRLLQKPHLTLDDVRRLIPIIHLYSYWDLVVIEWVVGRLYSHARSPAAKREINGVLDDLERGICRRR